MPVYSEPQLATGVSTPTVDSKTAIAERDRRDVERESYSGLSKYYLLKPRQKKWTRPTLLSHGKREHLT